MKRDLPLWVGKTPNQKIPARVKLRIWEREEGRCWISGRKIMPGEPYDFDHKIALINGGTHSEENLAPALRDKHREKTADDVAEKAKVARKAKANLGLKPAPAKPIQSAGFAPKAPKPSTARQPDKLAALPRRAMFR
jgi:5-methylcytosine-specific restriction protein A